MIAPYPWLASQWTELLRVADSGRLSHALLISGREGVGIEDLATAFANRLLCEASAPGLRPCGDCRGCKLFQAGTHPDFRTLAPAEQGKAIRIDQVREIAGFYSLKAHYDRGKIVIICPADAMNRAAANALLKTLEEPPAGALLLLVAQRFSAIPMTIRSRCIRVPCDHVDSLVALPWLNAELPNFDGPALGRLLAQTGGAPLTARAIANGDRCELESDILDAFALIQQRRTHALLQARRFGDIPLPEILRTLSSITSRLILAKFNRRSFYDQAEGALEPRLQGLSDRLDLKRLYALLDLLFESKALHARQSGMREVDVAETLWLGLADAAGCGEGSKER